MPGLPHPADVPGSARALPALGLGLSVTTLLALVVCLDALLLHDVPAAVAALAFTGAAIGLAGLGRAAASLVALASASRGLHRALADAPELPGHPGVVVVRGDAPRAWCAGLLRPRVAVSDGAVARLGAPALTALLAHEHHHARRRDGLRRGLADAVAAGLLTMPGTGAARERYAAVLELDADGAAAPTPATRRGLAAAMLALDGPGTGVDATRVDRLLGAPVRVDIGRRPLTAAAVLLGVLLATAVACTLATGCVDIFLLREEDATARRVELLPVLFLAATALAAAIDRKRPA